MLKRNNYVHGILYRLLLMAIVCMGVVLSSSITVFAAAEETGKCALNISVVYTITTAISFLLLIGYCVAVKNKKFTFVLLFTSVFVVNAGYAFLSMSRTLPEALLANRISYLGSVFLPLFMLLITMDECRVKCSKFILICLLSISVVVFFVAATPGYGTLYYKDVALVFVNGGAKLVKTYGPLHKIYYVYLALYFLLMILVIVTSWVKSKHYAPKLGISLLALLFGNIIVWFVEQVVRLDFEFLSISYIITEMYLLSLYNMMDDFYNSEKETYAEPAADVKDEFAGNDLIIDFEDIPDIKSIIKEWPAVAQLTTREVEVFRELILNKKRKEIADQLCVSENTIKKHTSNIFAKLNVSSRNEILKIVSKIK